MLLAGQYLRECAKPKCYGFQPVGCDHVLNSDTMLDRCEKCGGDGDTCFVVSSNYSASHKLKGNDKFLSFTYRV